MTAERVQRYAEAIRTDAALGESWGVTPASVMAVADAEQAELRAENRHNEWACEGNQRLLREATERAEAAEAKVARVRSLMAHLHTDLIYIGELNDALRDDS